MPGKRRCSSGVLLWCSQGSPSTAAEIFLWGEVLWGFPSSPYGGCQNTYLAPNHLVTEGSSGIAPSPQQSNHLRSIPHLGGHFLLCLQQQPVARSFAQGLHFSLRFSAWWRKVWAAKASGSVHVTRVSWHVKLKHCHKLKLLLKQLEFLLTAAITKKCL